MPSKHTACGTEAPALDFVLIPGAGFGGWVWREVAGLLRDQGHRVLTPTLAGVADRQDSVDAEVGLYSHAREIVATVTDNRLGNVVLVGWSYGGAVAAAALPDLSTQVRAVIFLDAFLPLDSSPLLEHLPAALRPLLVAWQLERPGPTLTLGSADWFGLDDPTLHTEVEQRLSAHPGRAFFEPLTPVDLSRDLAYAYVRCNQFPFAAFDLALQRARDSGVFASRCLATGHLGMLTHPHLLAQTLLELGARKCESDRQPVCEC
jgi:pimeloyl-ACP methyl ester carboxylesterase